MPFIFCCPIRILSVVHFATINSWCNIRFTPHKEIPIEFDPAHFVFYNYPPKSSGCHVIAFKVSNIFFRDDLHEFSIKIKQPVNNWMEYRRKSFGKICYFF